MSDFLDRVATRALGSESMLAPRLPSLFEPAGRSGAAVAEEPVQIQAALPTERKPEPSLSNVRQVEARVVADAPTSAPVRPLEHESATLAAAHERVVVTDDVRMLASSKPPVREAASEPVSLRTVSRQPPASIGELQPLQETHLLSERVVTEISRETPLGELRPPSEPVFATKPEPDAHRANASPSSSAKALAGVPAPSAEPVVHVSIGRLEVRAAPAGAPAPRHSTAPRPSALDDYLRQRGGPTP